MQKQERCHLGRWRLCRQLQKRKRSFGFLVESLPGQELRSMLTCWNVSTKFAMNFKKLGLFKKSKSFHDMPAFPQKNPQHEQEISSAMKKDFVATRLVSVICSSEPSPARSSLTDQLQQMHARFSGSKTKVKKRKKTISLFHTWSFLWGVRKRKIL